MSSGARCCPTLPAAAGRPCHCPESRAIGCGTGTSARHVGGGGGLNEAGGATVALGVALSQLVGMAAATVEGASAPFSAVMAVRVRKAAAATAATAAPTTVRDAAGAEGGDEPGRGADAAAGAAVAVVSAAAVAPGGSGGNS